MGRFSLNMKGSVGNAYLGLRASASVQPEAAASRGVREFPGSRRYCRPSPCDRVARVRRPSDAHAAHGGQPGGDQDSHQDGQETRQAHCAEGREEMADVMPGVGPGSEERPGKEHGDLASDEAHQADQGQRR